MKNHEFLSAVAHEFELSFLVTGLKPVNRRFGDGKGEGCLVTALDVSEHGNASADAFLDSLEQDARRIERVRDHLHAKFPVADREWWGTFVRYLILSFDHLATCPRRWMQRVCDAEFTASLSPKLMGAGAGGILRYRLLLARPVQEPAAAPLPRKREKARRRRRAAQEAVTVLAD
jgi:hypothetical protein